MATLRANPALRISCLFRISIFGFRICGFAALSLIFRLFFFSSSSNRRLDLARVRVKVDEHIRAQLRLEEPVDVGAAGELVGGG